MLNRALGKPAETVVHQDDDKTQRAILAFELWSEKNPDAGDEDRLEAIRVCAAASEIADEEFASMVGVGNISDATSLTQRERLLPRHPPPAFSEARGAW